MSVVTLATPATGAFGGAPHGATKRVRRVPKWARWWHATAATGLRLSSMWCHEQCEGCAKSGAVVACDCCHWGLRWSSPWGHDPREGCAEMDVVTHANAATGAFSGAPYGAAILARGVPKWGSMRGGDACGHGRWGLRWRSLWGHETCEGSVEMMGGAGAFGGDPYGATKRPRNCAGPQCDPATGTLGGTPYGSTKRARVCRHNAGPLCDSCHWGP